MIKILKFIFFSTIIIILITITYQLLYLNHDFNTSYSITIYDQKKQLIGARVAKDGQWRFTDTKSIPSHFEKSILSFEDANFYLHPGIDPKGIVRAIYLNLKNGKIVSGGSTITMQLARILRGYKRRNIYEKYMEACLAIALELKYTKEEILLKYMNTAPFGGNVVGIDAAAWRYFGHSISNLTLSESACLAVLPNAPSLIHPGKNKEKLKNKRNKLLKKLLKEKKISNSEYKLALLEKIPEKPKQLPNDFFHYFNYISKSHTHNSDKIITTLDSQIQKKGNDILSKHLKRHSANFIFNGCVLIIDNTTGAIKAYVGNNPNLINSANSPMVDMIQANRSTGSVIKPILFAQALSEGIITTSSLLEDIPIYLKKFTPKNFNEHFDGLVSAKEALKRSLNIPFVKLLQEYGVEKFHNNLTELDMQIATRFEPDHYGLSLILGGAETSPWEIGNTYFKLSQFLKQSTSNDVLENNDIYSVKPLNIRKKRSLNLSPAAIFQTFNVLAEKKHLEAQGQTYHLNQKVAWKTGTSFGFRDGWCVGVSNDYIVVVWVGNADGEGRPNLTGSLTAAPVLFDIMNVLHKKSPSWFKKPFEYLYPITICKETGYRPSRFCDIDSIKLCTNKPKVKTCPYHKKINDKAIFVTSPIISYYYNQTNVLSSITNKRFQIIAPRNNQSIFLPKNLANKQNSFIAKAVCKDQILFWQLNGVFIGTTKLKHEINIGLRKGKNHLSVTDEYGNTESVIFTVI
ncbi:MAG: penicillin-binding protein 1C [Hyphomicrobiales bacterium]